MFVSLFIPDFLSKEKKSRSYNIFSFLRTSLEQLRQEITKLFNQVNKIQNQMKNPKTQKDVQAQMSEFLPVSFNSSR